MVLGATPLDLISGVEDEREDLRVLMALLNDAEEQAGAATLRRWVRSGPITQRPIDLLARQDWAAFETALEDLDACHGHKHKVGGRRVYHYHATREFPYTLGCFSGRAG